MGYKFEPVLNNVPAGGKHIVIHRKFSTCNGGEQQAPQLIQTIFEATVIDKSGLILPNFGRKFYEGQAIIKHIGMLSSLKGNNRHVFSTMDSVAGHC
jgi:hypothetical protein